MQAAGEHYTFGLWKSATGGRGGGGWGEALGRLSGKYSSILDDYQGVVNVKKMN